MARAIEKILRANEDSFAQLYTEAGFELMIARSRSRRRTPYDLNPRQINNNYRDQSTVVYGWDPDISPLVQYSHALRVASVVAVDIQHGVLPPNKLLGIHNEIEIPHTNTSKRLERVAGIKASGKRVAVELSWQSLVDMVFTHGAALVNTEYLKTGINDTLSDLHDWLSDRLYSGDEGKLHKLPFNSYHSPETNRTVAVGSSDRIAPSPLITREHLFEVRHVNRLGYVFSHPRIKGPSAVEKMVDEAILGDGVMRPEEIRDKAGIEMIAIGERPLRDMLMERVMTLLKTHPDKNGDPWEDHFTGKKRGQNPIEWKRIQFPMKGGQTVEFIFKALIDHMDQQQDVGIEDSDTGELNGDGHRIFESRRKGRLIRAAYPSFIYRPQDLDLEALIAQGREALAIDMLSGGKTEGLGDINGTHKNVLTSPLVNFMVQ